MNSAHAETLATLQDEALSQTLTLSVCLSVSPSRPLSLTLIPSFLSFHRRSRLICLPSHSVRQGRSGGRGAEVSITRRGSIGKGVATGVSGEGARGASGAGVPTDRRTKCFLHLSATE